MNAVLIPVNADTTTIRRARANHECIACDRTISVGDEYAEYAAMAEGPYASGPRYCAACAATEGLAR